MPDPADPPAGCRFHARCPELIPPEDVDLPPESWRAVAAFRFGLAAGELPPTLDLDGSTVPAEGDGDPESDHDSGPPTGEDTASRVESSAVRRALDLPTSLPDERVDGAVEAACEAVARGDLQAAEARLAEAVPTVCERAVPRAVEVDARPVRCHRYDPEREGEPIPPPNRSIDRR